MKFLLPMKTFKLWKGGSFTREDALVWGTLGLVVVLILLLSWDGIIFYRFQLRPIAEEEPVSAPAELSAEDIDRVIATLDQREREFQNILR